MTQTQKKGRKMVQALIQQFKGLYLIKWEDDVGVWGFLCTGLLSFPLL